MSLFSILSAKFDQVAGIIAHRERFPHLNTVHSMVTTKEMRLKSKSQDLHAYSSSSSPTIPLAQSGSGPIASLIPSRQAQYQFKSKEFKFYLWTGVTTPMLEKGNYIPWESRLKRFLENRQEEGEHMWRSIAKGPYVRPMIANPDDTNEHILEPTKMLRY
ncbi:hypothetical protein Tco_0546252 [Tanacetum coccineum]